MSEKPNKVDLNKLPHDEKMLILLDRISKNTERTSKNTALFTWIIILSAFATALVLVTSQR